MPRKYLVLLAVAGVGVIAAALGVSAWLEWRDDGTVTVQEAAESLIDAGSIQRDISRLGPTPGEEAELRRVQRVWDDFAPATRREACAAVRSGRMDDAVEAWVLLGVRRHVARYFLEERAC